MTYFTLTRGIWICLQCLERRPTLSYSIIIHFHDAFCDAKAAWLTKLLQPPPLQTDFHPIVVHTLNFNWLLLFGGGGSLFTYGSLYINCFAISCWHRSLKRNPRSHALSTFYLPSIQREQMGTLESQHSLWFTDCIRLGHAVWYQDGCNDKKNNI